MNGVKYFPFGVKLLIFKSNHFERHKKILRIINVKQQLIKIIVTSFGKHLTSSNVQKNSKKKRKKESKNPQTKDINKKRIFFQSPAPMIRKKERERQDFDPVKIVDPIPLRASAHEIWVKERKKEKKKKRKEAREEKSSRRRDPFESCVRSGLPSG